MGRPGNNHGSFSSLYDVSADYAVNRNTMLTAYYARAFGKTVVGTILSGTAHSHYGYVELLFRLSERP